VESRGVFINIEHFNCNCYNQCRRGLPWPTANILIFYVEVTFLKIMTEAPLFSEFKMHVSACYPTGRRAEISNFVVCLFDRRTGISHTIFQNPSQK
jgi:hypothetical protein